MESGGTIVTFCHDINPPGAPLPPDFTGWSSSEQFAVIRKTQAAMTPHFHLPGILKDLIVHPLR
jgi:hypothetical protein